jgi:uncharacterized membrane protein YhaH (DUF805 family)
MKLSQLLFSSKGRIPRSTWWCFNIPLIFFIVGGFILMVLYGPQDSVDQLALMLFCGYGILCILLIYPSLMVNIKRYHDRDKAGWSLLGYYLPAFLFVLAIILLFSGMVDIFDDIWSAGGVILVLAWGVYDISIIVELGLLQGTPGPNKYGPDPRSQP